jgi:AraC-like DNA-binding protein
VSAIKEYSKEPYEVLRQILVGKFCILAPKPGRYSMGLNWMHLIRYDNTVDYVSSVMKPALILLFNAKSENIFGNWNVTSKQCDFAVVGIQVPLITHIMGSPENPYLVLLIHLNMGLVAELCNALPPAKCTRDNYEQGISYGKIDAELMGHLIKLFDDLNVRENDGELVPPVLLDIYAHILQTPQGALLRRVSTLHSNVPAVNKSIQWLTEEYNKEFCVENLAEIANMPPTTFHRYFKAITSLSPMQYLKAIRIFEARRKMLFCGKNALEASQEVGYVSPSHFNREYKRIFMRPPRRDISNTLYNKPPMFQPFDLNFRPEDSFRPADFSPPPF